MNKTKPSHLILLFINISFLIWSGINPTERLTWLLEVGPTTIVLLVLVFTYRKFQFSTLSYFIFSILIILTYIGGHFTYDDVPLFEWIKDMMHLKRNHYDRFGHLFKGLFIVPIKELLIRKGWIREGVLLNIMLASFVLSLAALYELAEWISAMIVGESARDFLGTQGDVWDSQWDMALALLGAYITMLIFRKKKV
ncbi:MAG: hypothetical protein K0R71_1973 [Bacillales bacterium]|jgi:putative membrane protein|nr:hypothetical protein [Bacillales bacterium]